MKLGVELMIDVFIFMTGMFFSFSIYATALEISDAKQYHMWIMEKLEGSKYAQAVQEECENQAEEQGYQLTVEEVNEDQSLKKVTLKYKIALPLQNTQRDFQVSSYSY